MIAVGLKNSKQIVFFDIIKDENNKLKLNKQPNPIITSRKYEINKIVITRDGNYVATSGKDQDTLIQVYEVKTGKEVGSIEINEIRNVEMKISPDDNHLTISTLMMEIAVIEFKKTVRFNKAINGDETTIKLQRNKSVSGIKVPIDSYEFSNDNKFFIATCENKKVKIFQNYGNVEESKVHHEFLAKEIPKLSNDKVSLYVTGFNIGKLTGYVAVSQDYDIYLYDTDGNLVRVLKNAHDGKINLIKIARKEEKNNDSDLVIISASRDGRFHVWKI